MTLCSPAQFLQAVAPQLLRATLKQLSSKSVPTRQQCFVLLRQTAEALAGGLDSEADRICSAAIGALRSCDSATTSALLMAALSFLAAFFRCHTARCYLGHLVDLVSVIVRSMKHKLQRVNFEAFAAASSLAQSIRPKGSASPLPNSFSRPVGQLFDATTEVLADSSVDSEVRERALETLGSLLAHEGDALTPSYSMCLPLISDRLGNDNTAITAIQVIGKIVESPVCKGQDFDAWLLNVLPNVVVAIRKSKRSAGRSAEFVCLQHMLGRVGSGLPKTVAEGIIVELKPFIETPTALHIVALILAQQPACRSTVEEQLLPLTMEAVKTPSINPNMIDALTAFFAAYIDGDIDAATRLGSSLVDNLGKAESLPDATRGGTSTYTATARCVGVVVEHSQRNAAGVVSMFQKTMKVILSPYLGCVALTKVTVLEENRGRCLPGIAVPRRDRQDGVSRFAWHRSA